ncbi:MAG: biotin/lipoyl-binding protein, partial [Alphaproteobacteria bacterium]|nr:biotin/lipoyl-binding protein [Alphaproteobacteria bacterium]
MSSNSWGGDLHSGEIGSETERGSSRFAHVLLFIIVVFFITFVVWAHTASLDEVTRGDGKIVPSGQIQKVQNLEGGIVAAINIREGDIVAKDQILLRIENVQAAADLRESRGKYLSLLATIARLEAETEGRRDMRFPDEVTKEDPDSASSEMQLFSARLGQL